MKRRILLALSLLLVAGLACGQQVPAADNPAPTTAPSVFDDQRTVYGFFPTPSEASIDAVFATMQGIGQHADVALFQQEIPWTELADSPDAKSKKVDDLRNMVKLAAENGLEPIFIVDPLNGLNRREFQGLPPELADGNFGTPQIRSAFTNYALRLVREFHPRYLGLASEINTYMAAFPDDAENYLSLYRATYDAIKAESPDTQVFVTFQWDGLNNLGFFHNGNKAFDIQWEQIEVFEPQLDIWAISSYPCFFFDSAAAVPDDYYTPLLTRTNKPIAIAEGGCASIPLGIQHGSEQDQVDYLHKIDDQLGGERLTFWIYLLYNDLNMDSFATVLPEDTAAGLTYFAHLGFVTADGIPKPALDVWDTIRNSQ